ncbi:recombinase family protein [Granulicella tundricola]|uniref:Resolvase domain protein n=1 Tax=Granulicella tundricola (strain ATCC BAA-1859 / DSM 23138 / MP5ACTX9) TaxID=1198114 RepID=E8X7M7_GRATM|nr:recombinase family protein [Granulicella tundricola]ADW71461.1 Resolvase domain protein [Granulicella tundricola MP5ACTX9]
MANDSFVSYLRVSTVCPGVSGLSLEAQRTAVAGFLNGGRWTHVREIVEIESGKRNDRPTLAEALALCKRRRATLVIAKLDRLARNIHFITGLMESGVDFLAVDMPEANPTMIRMMAVFAQHEAEAISSRTKAALAAAKARGTKLGGRRVSSEEFAVIAASGRRVSAKVRSAKAAATRAELLPVIAEIRGEGKGTLQQIAAELNARGEKTPRGGDWSPVQVMRVIGSRKPRPPIEMMPVSERMTTVAA